MIIIYTPKGLLIFIAVNLPTSSTSPAAQFLLPTVTVPRPPARSFAFHNLDSNSTYIDRSAKSDWRKMTEKSMAVYERVYEASRNADGTVSSKCLASNNVFLTFSCRTLTQLTKLGTPQTSLPF